MGYFSPREVETGIACPQCGKNLHIGRSCHEVAMNCPHCHKSYPLRDYIGKEDEAMEKFLENVYMDRI